MPTSTFDFIPQSLNSTYTYATPVELEHGFLPYKVERPQKITYTFSSNPIQRPTAKVHCQKPKWSYHTVDFLGEDFDFEFYSKPLATKPSPVFKLGPHILLPTPSSTVPIVQHSPKTHCPKPTRGYRTAEFLENDYNLEPYLPKPLTKEPRAISKLKVKSLPIARKPTPIPWGYRRHFLDQDYDLEAQCQTTFLVDYRLTSEPQHVWSTPSSPVPLPYNEGCTFESRKENDTEDTSSSASTSSTPHNALTPATSPESYLV